MKSFNQKCVIYLIVSLTLELLPLFRFNNIYSRENSGQYSVAIIHKQAEGDHMAVDGWLVCAGLVIEKAVYRSQVNDSCKTELDAAIKKVGYKVSAISLDKNQEDKSSVDNHNYDICIVHWEKVYEHTKYSHSSPLTLDITINYEVNIIPMNKKYHFKKKIRHSQPSGSGSGNDGVKKAAQKETAEEYVKEEMVIILSIINWLDGNLNQKE